MLASEQESSYQDQLQEEVNYLNAQIEDARRIAAYSNRMKAETAKQEFEAQTLGFKSASEFNEAVFNERNANLKAEIKRLISPYQPVTQQKASSFSYTQPTDRQIIALENARKLYQEREYRFNKHLRATIIHQLRNRKTAKPMKHEEKADFMKKCNQIARETLIDYIS